MSDSDIFRRMFQNYSTEGLETSLAYWKRAASTVKDPSQPELFVSIIEDLLKKRKDEQTKSDQRFSG